MPKRLDLDRIKELVRTKFERRNEVRLICFGASVTAQTGEAGFYSYLGEYLSRSLPGVTFKLDRMAFAAEVFRITFPEEDGESGLQRVIEKAREHRLANHFDSIIIDLPKYVSLSRAVTIDAGSSAEWMRLSSHAEGRMEDPL